MTKRLAIGILALVLIGAGCRTGGNSDNNVTITVPDVPEQQAPAPAPTPEPEPIVKEFTFPGTLPADQIENKQIRLKTEKGDIVFELFADTAPNTVSNFVYLTGEEYYNSLTFHRREEGFVIQGGDPRGNGTGGPGYRFEDELNDEHGYERGIVAMANSGPNTNGSQFFIMLDDTPLPKLYSIFGRVTEGIEVVDQIQIGDKMLEVTVEDKQ